MVKYSIKTDQQPDDNVQLIVPLNYVNCIWSLNIYTHYYSFAESGSAYSGILCLAALQLANFHHPGCFNFAMFNSTHLMGPGIGGQSLHAPSSNSASKLNRKKGRTSVMPEFCSAAPSRFSNSASVDFSRSLPGLGVFGWCAKFAMVVTSLRMCFSNGSWNVAMISSNLVPEKSVGDGRPTRYSRNLVKPGMNSSVSMRITS